MQRSSTSGMLARLLASARRTLPRPLLGRGARRGLDGAERAGLGAQRLGLGAQRLGVGLAVGLGVGLALALVGCGARTLVPTTPAVHAVAAHPVTGTYVVHVGDVPTTPICSFDEVTGEICIAELRQTYQQALERIAPVFIRPGRGPRFLLILRVETFGSLPAGEVQLLETPPSRLELEWQLIVKTNANQQVLAVRKKTWGKALVSPSADRNDGVAARVLVEQTLQEMVDALNAANLYRPEPDRVFEQPAPHVAR